MADGYAQASGRLAVVNLHVTPGLGNAMGMLYDAQKAGSPILVTAGQHDLDFNVTEPILWADLPTLARPLVKWAAEVQRLADLPRLVHRAAKTALAPPTGPVFLSLPGDILKAEGEIDLSAPTRVAARLRGDAAAVAEAAAVLAQAKRPLIIAGDAVAHSRAHAELVELAETLGAPVYAEIVPSTASFPASHPLFRGAMARMQEPIRKVLEQYDLLFSVGGDLFTLSLPSDDRSDAGRSHAHPPRQRSLGARQELSAEGRDPRRPEGHLAGTHRGAARAHDRRRTRRGARAARRRQGGDARRARGAYGQGARQGERHAAAALGPARRDRRDAAEGRGRDRRDAYRRGRACARSCAATIRRAFMACAAAASAGACRRRSASSSRCPSARWWRSSATAAPCTPARRCGPRRTTTSPSSSSSSTTASYRILKQRLRAQRGAAAQVDRYVGMELVDPPIDYLGLARSLGVAAERATTVHEATDLVARGLKSGAPLLIDVPIDRALR